MPILLSIGYSSCHWCHVMERESFEDGDTAKFMNEHFVPVKVDREERPDVDAIYMEAVQGMTGQGGWPLTAFCDPDGVPFYGGTYFPPEPRHGMPSFPMLMEAVAESWGSQRERIRGSAENIRAQLQAVGRIEPSEEAADPGRARRDGPPAADGGRHGERRLRRGAQVPARLGDRAAAGARRDARFPLARSTRWPRAESTTRWAAASRATRWTRVWLVPHFEKMLYDNALLARAYLHGFQALGHERWRTVCERTLDWALREMRGPEGGFYSALDADSEGEEGRFYVWSRSELEAALGAAGLEDEAAPIIEHWGATDGGELRGPQHPAPARGRRRRRAARPRAGPGGPLRAPLGARVARPRRQAHPLLERADDRRAGRCRGRAGPCGLPRRGDPRRRVRPRPDARRRGPAASHLEGGRGQAERLPRGPRVPDRGAARPVRGDLRRPLVRRRARDRRHDDRALRRLRARRVLHHLTRPRGAHRPPQGRRGPPDPVRQLVRRPRPAAALGANGRAGVRAPGDLGLQAPRTCSPRATRTRSPTCCGRSTSTSPP